MGGNTTTNAGKLRASDFADDSYIKAEQGVFIEATPSIMRTDLGVTSASDVEDGDFLQSDGTDWVPKSISEMKTLLGLPQNTYIGGGYFSYYGGEDNSSLSSLIYNDFGITPTLTAGGATGTYIVQLPASYALDKGFGSFRVEYDSILDKLPTDYTVEVDQTSHGFNIQFKESGINAALPTDVISVYFKVFIQKWMA